MVQEATVKNALILLGVLVLLAFWSTSSATPEEHRFHSSLQIAAPDEPFVVSMGVQIDQVVNIDQRSENFEVVGNLRMEWDNPAMAFQTAENEPKIKLFVPDAFVKYVDQNHIFAPGFLIENQQGRRFIQDSTVSVSSNGHAIYLERFTVTLQAPEFDFTNYPFDSQTFFLHVTAQMPINYVVFQPLPGSNRIGDQLGEEEWIIEKSWTVTDEVVGITGKKTARFSFGLEGSRHLNYYYLRIFLPLLIIILVSWFTFFLNNYGKRVDLAVTNLLVFVAFNFTISSDLPRLGYQTFIDTIMFTAFVFAALVVLVSVIFRRMETYGRESLARRLDSYMIWAYPVALTLLIVSSWVFFMMD
jgi:hypothetical protein